MAAPPLTDAPDQQIPHDADARHVAQRPMGDEEQLVG